ncbi:MAG: class I SAM-dependent methyltransferase [Gammaproteobacteria bacterium]
MTIIEGTKVTNLYSNSWQFYKAQSETFIEDQEYYYDFCKNYKTLDLFAGYGRLTNFLANRKIDIEIVELEKEFAKFINIDTVKKHTQNVLHFTWTTQFERIIAGCNSFCLFTKDEDIKEFFSQVDALLVPGGYASLNYFDTHYWNDAPSGELLIDGMKIKYVPTYDLSKAKKGHGLWIDEYEFICANKTEKRRFEYPVRVYENATALYPFYKHTSLELVDSVENFGLDKDKISEPGWIDYVFKKKF